MGFLIGMELLQNIRNDRERQRRGRPLQRSAFHTIICIIREYGLNEDFLKQLDNSKDYSSQAMIELTEVKAKKAFEAPPFLLVSQEEYSLARTLIGKLGNPFLQFAHSPEEIVLSLRLYETNPRLGSQDLLRYDFETLFLCQRAKEELADLEKRLGKTNGSGPTFFLERIKQLRAFIAKVENRELQPE